MLTHVSHNKIYALLQRFFRVLPEHQDEADKTLQGACRKLTPQQFYNQKNTTMNTYSSEKLGKRAPKHQNVFDPPDMTLDDFMAVSNMSTNSYVAPKLQLQFMCFK